MGTSTPFALSGQHTFCHQILYVTQRCIGRAFLQVKTEHTDFTRQLALQRPDACQFIGE